MVTAEHEVSLFNIQDLPPRYAIAFACQAARKILPLFKKEIGEFGEAALRNVELISQGKTPAPMSEAAPSGDPMSIGNIFHTIGSVMKDFSSPEATEASASGGSFPYEAVYESAQRVMDYLNKLTTGANAGTQQSIVGMLHEIYDTLMRHHDITGQDTVDSSIFSNR